MIGTYTLHRTWSKLAGNLFALVLLAAVMHGALRATDSIDVVDENGQNSTYIASRPATFSWPTSHTASSGPNWGTTTKLALYASRAALPLTIATGLTFNGDTTTNTIVAPNRINLTANPVGTVSIGDTLVISGCTNANNNGVFVVATVGANFLTVAASAGWTTENTPVVVAAVNPGLIRTNAGTPTVTVRTTAAHGLTANTSFVVILPTNDASFTETLVQVLSTPTATTFTYSPGIGGLDASSNDGTVQIQPGPIQDAGPETQFIQEVANTGSLTRALPNLIGTDVYYFLVDEANPSERIYSGNTVTVRGIQLTSPVPGNIVTANQSPSPTEIRMEMLGYPASAFGTTFTFTLSRDGLFSGGSNDEFLANLISGGSAEMTATATTLRGATQAFVFRTGATVWTAPLTPEARVRVKTLANTSIGVDVTDETGPTSGASNDPLNIAAPGGYIDRAFRIGPGTGPVPMFTPNGSEVVANVQLNGGLQTTNSTTVRYIPLGSTTLPVTTITDGMVLEFSGDSGTTWEPLSKQEYQAVTFTAPDTINVVSGSTAPIRVGAPVVVRGSSLNDGMYTVSSVGGSSFTVVETIQTETIPGTSAPATIMVGVLIDPSSSRFTWATTQDPSSRCRLRTRLLRTSLPADIGSDNGAIINDIVDTSNQDFTLRGIVWKGLTSATLMPVGTTQTLTWVSAGSSGRVNILLSRNGGLSHETIVANTEDDGTFDWLVTGPVSSNCLLQVQQADNPALFFDTSPTFTIQGYTVVTPNGGEVFQIGSLQSVLWISAGMPVIPQALNSVDITLTFTDPATGNPATLPIATNVPNSLNFGWTLANTIPGVTDARVQISNNDPVLKLIGPGLSANPFTIQRAITVTAPNGGNSFVVGEKTNITWTTTGLPILAPSITGFIRPELLVGTLIESPANAGAVRASNLVTIKTISAHGYTTGDNILITDLSDNTFNGTFTITVTSATTFTYAKNGIDANTGNGVAYKASRVLGGAKIDSVANTGISRLTGTVTVNTITAHGYSVGDSVRVIDVSDPTFNGNQVVVTTPTANRFTYTQAGVDTASGGGTTYKLGPAAAMARINGGSLSTVWTSDDVSDLCRVRVLEVNSANTPQPAAAAFTNDVSDSSFSIKTFVSEPEAISVTAPNGGESFILGQSVPITWTSSGQVTRSNTVTIRLTRDTTDNQGENIVLATNVANTGSFTWLVVGAPTNRARIVVTSDADSNVTDVSDGDFIIKGIQVLSPNALSDSVTVGSPLNITWNFGFTTATDTVKIEISRDGGTTFTDVVASTPNNGGFLWVSLQPVSASAKIRVTSIGDATLTDSSDVTFQLRGLSLTAPSGGETWNQGTQQNVSWTSVGAGSFVNLDLSLDGGKSFQRIATHATNNGSLVWTVAQPFSGVRLLKTVNFVAGTNTINFVAGSNLAGIAAGDKVTVSGTASNNGIFTVATVSGASITCTNTLVNETVAVDASVALASVALTSAFTTTRVLKTVSFTPGTNTITFLAASNMTGLQVGDTIKVTGTVSNNGTYVIATIGANSVTVTTPLTLEAIGVDATVNMQLTNIRTLRTVSFDGTNRTINLAAGTLLNGLAAGQQITVTAPSINAGVYTIASLGANSIVVTGTLSNETLAVDARVTSAATAAFYISQPSAAAMLRLTDTVNSANADISDSAFTIPPISPGNLMFAPLPNPQAPFQFGTASTLQWNGLGLGATATLELSTDSGVTFSLVDAAVPNNTNTTTSTYLWTAPNIATTLAVLRLKSNVSPNPSISTAGVFTISAPTVPSLVLTPTPPGTINFTAIESGTDDADKTGTIKNIGSLSTTYNLTVPVGAPWLQIALQPTSGSPVFGSTVTNVLAANATDTILFRSKVAGLAPGTFTGVVGLVATGGALGQVPFTVNFTVTPAGIGLVAPVSGTLVVTAPEGSSVTSVVTIQNRTAAAIVPTVSGVPSYVTMTPFAPASIAAGSNGSSTLTFSGIGLSPGVYTATITIDNAGADPKRTFTIQFTVTGAKISFENKKKSCSIGSTQSLAGVAGFLLPFTLLALLWVIVRLRTAQPRFSQSAARLRGPLVLIALVLVGAAGSARAATVGSAEEGPALFGLDVHVPVMLQTIDFTDVFALTPVAESVPFQNANFGGVILSSGWVNQNPRGWLPRNLFAELQLGIVVGSGIANIQGLSGASTTRYDARMFNGRMLFAIPFSVDLDENVRMDDRRPTAFNLLATLGYHYILVDFDKTTVNEMGRGLEAGLGASGEYGFRTDWVAFASALAVGRFQTYNNAFKDSKFNSAVEGQFAAGVSCKMTSNWQAQFQATGTLTQLTDFHRFGVMLSFRYGRL